ncbi:DUF3822 family protein [Flavobacteriaceae bacterium R38]|nr:DUF3822 family protein [Flavobacteriaceae bacterium R38]
MTLKRKISIQDLTNKELSIQVSLNGLSFCVLDRFNTVIETIQHFQFDDVNSPEQLLPHIEGLFDDTSSFKNTRKINVIYVNELSSFIPKSLFSEDHLSDYLKFNVKILKNDYLTHDEIGNSDLVNVYVPFININNFFFDLFGAFDYKHYSSILVETLLHSSGKNEDPIMYVHVEKTHFEIVVIQNKKLVFYNTFEYFTKEDFIYYILFSVEQLDLNPEVFQLYFIGDIHEEDAIYQVTYNYIRNVQIADTFKNYEVLEGKNIQNFSQFILQNSF